MANDLQMFSFKFFQMCFRICWQVSMPWQWHDTNPTPTKVVAQILRILPGTEEFPPHKWHSTCLGKYVYRVTVKRCCWCVQRSSNSWRCLLARLSFCYASHSSICWLTPPHKERITWYSRESRIPGFALFMKHCVRRPSKMEMKHRDPFGPYLAIQKNLYKREEKRTEK